MMKAAVFYGPKEYKVEDVNEPKIAEDEILLRIHACGLCGSDLRTLQYGHPRITPPLILGHEISGEVAVLGRNSQGLYHTGDRLAIAPIVYCGSCSHCRNGRNELCSNYLEFGQAWPGGMAEYMRIPAVALRNGCIHIIPEKLDSIQATVSEPLAACLHAIERVDFDFIKTAVIFGAGTIGCLLMQLVVDKGVEKVILIDPNVNRLEIAEKILSVRTLNNTSQDIFDEIKKTNPEGVDLIFTATAAPIVQKQALQIAGKACQIIVFSGLPKEHSELNIDYNQIHYQCLKILGSSIYATRHHQQALHLIENGTINVRDLITTFPLPDFDRGTKMALKGDVIKAVFIPND